MLVLSRRAGLIRAGAIIRTGAALAMIAACSTFGSAALEPEEGGLRTPEASTDAAVSEASAADSPRDAVSEDAGRRNILENGSFETGCTAWEVGNGDLTTEE